MWLLAYLFGILWAFLVPVGELLILKWTDFEIQSLLIIVIPVWWFIVWCWVSEIFIGGLQLFQKKIGNFDVVFAVFISIFSFFLFDYFTYSTLYFLEKGDDVEVVFKLNRPEWYEAIRDYTSFPLYVVIKNCSESTYQLTYKGVWKGPTFDLSRWWETFLYFLQILWVIIWAIVTMHSKRKSLSYCDECKRYKKTKFIKRIPPIQPPTMESFQSWKWNVYDSLEKNAWDVGKILNILIDTQNTELSDYKKWDTFCDVSLVYCDKCWKGHLLMTFFEMVKDDTKEVSSYKIELKWSVLPLVQYKWDEENTKWKKYKKEKEEENER